MSQYIFLLVLLCGTWFFFSRNSGLSLPSRCFVSWLMIMVMYAWLFVYCNECLLSLSEEVLVPWAVVVWGGLSGGLLLASVATIHKGLTHGVSYRVVGVTFLQLTTTALLVRSLVLGGYSDALGFLVEKYFWGVMWGLLLYSSKWFVKPLMGKWFIRMLWAVPLLIYSGMFVYWNGDFWTLSSGVFSSDHSAFICGVVGGVCMFCALLEFWDDMSKMAVVPGYLSLTLVVVSVICYIYYQDDLTLAYRWMDMYWWGYGLGFLVTGFKWSISREVSDELLLGMWVVSLECYVGFFSRWHVEFWSMSSGIFSSEHVAALCGVVLGALAYYMVGVSSKGGEFTWYEHGLMLAIMLSGWVGCDWWYGGAIKLVLPWLHTYWWGFLFGMLLVEFADFIKSMR